MKLFLASVFTLLLLSGFLATILFAFMYVAGYIDAILLPILVVLLNFILWLVSPTISDFIYRYFFKARWISLSDLRSKSKSGADLIEATCTKYGFNIPKVGIVPDKNPNAFTYGSGQWNARIIVSEGIFHYLDDKNIAAVYGHELGHIKNRDFIVMTAASTIIQLLYVMFIMGVRSGRGGGSKKGGGYLALIGIASYIFYWIGQYIVLYLSRVREYYADQFSAEETKDPNSLSVALIRIAYGILTNPDDVKLVNTTKNLGIMNFSAAKATGLTYYMSQKLHEPSMVDKSFLFDLHNPWAFVYELGSTHPLTGKRIRRLSMLSRKFGKKPAFDFDVIERAYQIDKGKLRANFLKDLLALSIPLIVALGFPLFYLYGVLAGMVSFQLFQFLALWLMLIGLGMIIRTVYRYPGKKPERLTVLQLMGDVYASPVRGRRVLLDGKFIGRGIPGFIFSEDLMMQDKTGLMYLNYQSWIPLFGNIFFALSRVKSLIGRPAQANGWFLRGISSRTDLSSLHTEGRTISSYIKAISIFWGLFFICAGLLIGMLFGFTFTLI